MHSNNLKGIAEFIVVVEQGSFSAAAIELNMTRARVSQIISQLEKQLGVQLLHRSTRAMKLTEVGRHFYQQSLTGLNIIQQALITAQAEQDVVVGTIRINSVGGMFGEQILTPLICQFRHLYPLIDIDLDFSSQHIGLLESNYDLAIRMGNLPDSNLIARPLASYKTYVCAAPAYLEKHNIKHPRELKHAHVITGSIRKWRFKHIVESKNICEVEVSKCFSCANGHVARTAALLANGVIRVPAFYVAEDVKQGRLVELFDDWQLAKSKVSIVYPNSAYKARRIQLFIDYLLAHIHRIEQAHS